MVEKLTPDEFGVRAAWSSDTERLAALPDRASPKHLELTPIRERKLEIHRNENKAIQSAT